MSDHVVTGTWVYRSYLSSTDLLNRFAFNLPHLSDEHRKKMIQEFGEKAVKLMWAEGTATLGKVSGGQAEGSLVFAKYVKLALTATIESDDDGTPRTIRIEAAGRGFLTKGLKYTLLGWFVDPWPESRDQKPTVVGSIINRGKEDPEPVGTVGSFILVKAG